MFSKGSRYRNLTESSAIDASGERQRGKDLRLTPTVTGSYLHTVRDGDRLDLIAHKYYSDPAKWWQISDANPQQPFPTDLVDSWPVVGEHLVLEHPAFVHQFYGLLAELQQLLNGESDPNTLISLEMLNGFNQSELSEMLATPAVIVGPPDFFTASVVLIYPPSSVARSDVLGKLKEQGFNLLGTDEWMVEINSLDAESNEWIVERRQAVAFAFDDLDVKAHWQMMMDELADLTGVLQVESFSMEMACDLFYVSAQVTRAELLKIIESHGFELTAMSSTFSRIGAKFVVPPNQILPQP